MDDEVLFGVLDTRDPKELELMEKLLFENYLKYKDDFSETVSEPEKKAV